MKFKGTKGDWMLVEANDISPAEIRTEGHIFIAEIQGDFNVTKSEDAANAHLISAAPELLEALSGIVDLYSEINPALLTGDVADRITASKKAINKALGQ